MIEVKGEEFKTEEEARKAARESALREAMINIAMTDIDKIANNSKVIVELPLQFANDMYLIADSIKENYVLINNDELKDLIKKGAKK